MTEVVTAFTRNTLRLSLALFVIIVLLMAADVVDDYQEGQSWLHISMELMVVLLSLCGIFLLGLDYYRITERNFAQLHVNLQHAQAEAVHWRTQSRSLMQGLGLEIKKQFTLWGLSRAEAEIALLMLKGFSHHEIAVLRQSSERTVREQARAVYRKAGLTGKAELSAFFLEELLLPGEEMANRLE
ncbi:helix-turn-helix transcriptional regulator [Methylophilus aquaticus]|uniref:HTH luxR-type domain-containing protein n=1 Tax=Methylophilus aquaticus TaxID=1971610 RepID=A0ABT9JSU0_9PROT|nr:hypothetical protein [Methylophilus aquaticus]MDP8567623.1 hypothetical protein [Methylophilus aquaticus]